MVVADTLAAELGGVVGIPEETPEALVMCRPFKSLMPTDRSFIGNFM
jgi:hypothetical protein